MKKIILILMIVLMGTGFILAGEKDDQKIDEYRKSVSGQPDSIELHRAYQNLSRDLGKIEEIKKEYRTRLDQEPKQAVWHYLYGRLLGGVKMEKEFKAAVKLDPDFYWGYYGLGHYYKDQVKWAEAVKSFEKSLAVNPEFQEARHGLALTFYARGDLVKAQNIWEETIKSSGKIDPEMRLALGLCYKAQQKYDTAIKFFEGFLSRDKNYWQVYEPLIQCYHARKNYAAGQKLRDQIKDLHRQTADQDFKKQTEIIIDMIKLDRGGVVVSEKLVLPEKTRPGIKNVIYFNVYADTVERERIDKIISFVRRRPNHPDGENTLYEFVYNRGFLKDSCLLKKYPDQTTSYENVLSDVIDLLGKNSK